jgi:nitric oxide reductase large subunit
MDTTDSQKDDEINRVLSQDKYITDSNQNTINNYIKSENVKPKKISQSFKNFIFFSIIILLIAVAVFLYILETQNTIEFSTTPIIEENSIELVDKTFNATNLENTDN